MCSFLHFKHLMSIAMDWCTFGVRSFFSNAPRNVMSSVYFVMAFALILYYFIGETSEEAYLFVFGYIVFFNNAWPPVIIISVLTMNHWYFYEVAVGICRYVWGPEAMKMFSSFMFFFAIGSIIATAIISITTVKIGIDLNFIHSKR